MTPAHSASAHRRGAHAESPRPTHEVRTVLVPIAVPNGRGQRLPVPAFSEVAPFLPSRIPPAPGDRPNRETPRLVAVRLRSGQGRTCAIARTPAGRPMNSELPLLPLDTDAACLSLWEIPGHGHVLACEDLIQPGQGSRRQLSGPDLRDPSDADVSAILASFGLTLRQSLVELFPRLDTRLPGRWMYWMLSEILLRTAHPGQNGALAGVRMQRQRTCSSDRQVHDCLAWVALNGLHWQDRDCLEASLHTYRNAPTRAGAQQVFDSVITARLRQHALASLIESEAPDTCMRVHRDHTVLSALIGRALSRSTATDPQLLPLCAIAESAIAHRNRFLHSISRRPLSLRLPSCDRSARTADSIANR